MKPCYFQRYRSARSTPLSGFPEETRPEPALLELLAPPVARAHNVEGPGPHGKHGERLAARQEPADDEQASRAWHGGVAGHVEAVPHAPSLGGLVREGLGMREAHEGLEVHIEAR